MFLELQWSILHFYEEKNEKETLVYVENGLLIK
jgi:hypothetical protein